MRAHATDVLAAPDTSNQLRLVSAGYLVAIGDDPAMTPVMRIAAWGDDEAARLAIFTLGRFKTAGSIAALKMLLEDQALAARHSQIEANLK